MKRNLPAPHDAISVEVEHYDGRSSVSYESPSFEALHAAGCIDADALNVFTKTRQRSYAHAIGHVKRQRWHNPLRWRVTWYTTQDHALTLPGVDLVTVEALPRTEAVALLHYLRASIGSRGLQTKHRAVGRFQRLVGYATMGNLILPDWPALVRARFQAAES